MVRRAKTSKKTSVKAEALKPEIKAVSVEKMVEENQKAVHTSDYQTYLRKLMKQAGNN